MSRTTTPSPPVAAARPRALVAHGDTRIDPYYWLRERSDTEVIAYLEAENEYAEAVTAPTAGLQEVLYTEMVGRVQQTDVSPPSFCKGYWSYTRTVAGLDYEIYCRRAASMDAPEQVLLDCNVLAKGHDYFDLGFEDRSPDQQVLAYAVDYTGSELYQLRFRDLTTWADLEDVIDGVSYGSAWAADGTAFFYVKPDPLMRPYQVWRHTLGTDPSLDVLVLHEMDERFELGVELTKSEKFVIFTSASQVTSECRFLAAGDAVGEPALIEPRRVGVEYSVDHQGDRFIILTNDGAPNFRLMAAPLSNPARAVWTDVVPERAGVRLNSIDVHADFVVLGERSEGLQRLEVLDCATGALHVVDQPEPTYTAFLGSNPVYDSHVMRFFYTSLTSPFSAYDYDMRTGERILVKEQPVRGGYDRADYASERIWATAPDGVLIPISLVYRRGLEKTGHRPTLLYAYGAYEISMDPIFDTNRVSLLDRGFTFAIAHVRGGGEMGRTWYEGGKLLLKATTFTDCIACAGHLIGQGYTSPELLAIRGRSAGGLLVGAVLNARPDLFACAVAQVPFVDALTTMLDKSLPLTANEFDEWGNPEDLDYYRYMKSYSPYDNVHEAHYPALLVTAGLNDPRVPYWEPAKWVARLRALNKGDRPVVLEVQMGAGHSGPSGRYDSWREEAFVTAFVLSHVGSAVPS